MSGIPTRSPGATDVKPRWHRVPTKEWPVCSRCQCRADAPWAYGRERGWKPRSTQARDPLNGTIEPVQARAGTRVLEASEPQSEKTSAVTAQEKVTSEPNS